MDKLTDEQEDKLIDALQNCTIFDVVIIGGGVAGLSAGIYAARDGFNTLILEGTIESSVDAPGGALLLTNEIENFPGFLGGPGEDLVDIMHTQAENFGAIIRTERVENLEVNLQAGEKHTITTTDGNTYCARAVIIATGAVARRLGIPGEDEFYGRGVSTCATCDGFFFREKQVAVVGGGDTAVEDALLLTRYAKKVHLLVRGDSLRSTGPEAREILTHPDVTILWNTSVEEVVANQTNTGVGYLKLRNHKDTSLKEELEVDGMFIAIGSDPATRFLKNSIVMTDSEGYVLTLPDSTHVQGALPGIFAAGDVADKVYRQAITSAGKAVQAALEARMYLNAPVPKPISRVTNRY